MRKVPIARRENCLWNAVNYEGYEYMTFASAKEDVKLQLDFILKEHGSSVRQFYIEKYNIAKKFGIKK